VRPGKLEKRTRSPRRQIPADAPFLDRPALCRRWGIGRATSYAMQRKGYLKPPLRLGPGVARWPLAEIEALEARAAEDRAGRSR
jgi:predicted DNA-binding transcriptional regulator AlpA